MQLQDIAISPNNPDPSLNTVECVTTGHGKAPPFPDWKNLLHEVCWYILFISLLFSQVASQWLIVQLREWKIKMDSSEVEAEKRKNDSQVAAVMLLSIVVFITGLSSIFFAWSRSTSKQDYYVWAFFISAMLVLARRAVWCFWRIYKNDNIDLYKLSLTKGHESDPSGNVISFFTLYPAIFMACHHLLWIMLGVITEPFWGISVLVAVISVSAILVFFFYDFYEYYLSHECIDRECERCSARRDWRREYWFPFFMSLFLVLGSCAASVLLIIVLLVVAQSFLSESLVSTLVQNGLVFFSTLWLGYLKLHQAKKPAETRNDGNGGNSNQSGQPNGYELVEIQVQ